MDDNKNLNNILTILLRLLNQKNCPMFKDSSIANIK